MSPRAGGLELRDLTVPFGDAPGLSGVSFSVAAGARLAIVGASGSGKTSLLRAISGDGRIAAGSVRVDGRDVTDAAPEARNVVLLAQTPLLFPHLSVFENVAFALRVRRRPGQEVRRRVTEALSAVRMATFGDRRPASLSGGQARRVALARAVVARPAVLLLDEPLAALDPALRDDVRRTILELHADYRPALVFVTHDLDEAGEIGDRVGLLLGRRLAQIGSPDELFRRPATPEIARFLGLANEIHGEVDARGRLHLAGRWIGPVSGVDRPGPVLALFGRDALRVVRDTDVDADVGRGTERTDAGAASLLVGRVRRLRHRPEGLTVEVAVEVDGDEPVVLRAEGDPHDPPDAGERVALRPRAHRMHLFPGG